MLSIFYVKISFLFLQKEDKLWRKSVLLGIWLTKWLICSIKIRVLFNQNNLVLLYFYFIFGANNNLPNETCAPPRTIATWRGVVVGNLGVILNICFEAKNHCSKQKRLLLSRFVWNALSRQWNNGQPKIKMKLSPFDFLSSRGRRQWNTWKIQFVNDYDFKKPYSSYGVISNPAEKGTPKI